MTQLRRFRVRMLRSVYARMFLVICAAAIPTFVGLCFYVFQQRIAFERLARDSAENYVELAARYQNWLISSAGETLKAIAVTPMMQSQRWDTCARYFSLLLAQHGRYINFGVIGADGALLCSGAPISQRPSLGDRPYFSRAMQASDFVVGEYQIGRITGRPSVAVALSLKDDAQQPYAVLYASLDLDAMAVTVADTNMVADARFLVLDRNGRLLKTSASRPAEVTENADAPGYAPIAADGVALQRLTSLGNNGSAGSAAPKGSIVMQGADGSDWQVTYMRTGPPQDPQAFTVVYEHPVRAMPAAANRDFWLTVGAILLLMALALSAGWIGMQAIIGRNLRYLTAAAQRLRQRDFSARVGGAASGQEFVDIAHQFDQMAQELGEREQETSRVMARQLGQNRILQMITAGGALQDTLHALVLFVEQQIDDLRAAVVLLDNEGRYVAACIAPSLSEMHRNRMLELTPGPGVGTTGSAMYQRQLVITEDIATDPAWDAFRDLRGDMQVCWAYPIISSSGRVLGSFTMYYLRGGAVGREQLVLSQMAAELAAVAVERSRIEQALTNSETEYRLLFERNPNPMWVYEDDSQRILAVNDPAIAHYGYSRETFLAMRVSDLLYTLVDAGQTSAPDDGIDQAQLRRVRHRRQDGSMILVDIAVFATSFGGHPAQLALVNDVTEREAMAHNLSERDQMLSLLMDSTAEAIYGTDLAGKCIFANNACVRLLGYRTAADLLGQDIHHLVHGRHEDGSVYPAFECPIRRTLHQGESQHIDSEVMWRRDGSMLPVEYWSYPIRRDGVLSGAMVTFLDITERRRQNDALAYQARHDPLTGLYNRAVLLDAMEQAVAACASSSGTAVHFAVLIVDLDGFKEVNDALGHQSGDLLLQQVAQRLRHALPATATLTRLGGDEFAILTHRLPAVESVSDLTRDLLSRLQQPFQLNDMQIQINASIGIACYPRDGTGTEILMRNADTAMYQAKREGTGFVFYHQADNELTPSRLLLMSELRNALAQHQFVLHYQPKNCMADGSLMGYEALVRWQHPQRGLLYPLDFVPMIEVSDLIHPLTALVIETAVKQCKAWHLLGATVSVAVNISTRNLLDVSLVQRVQQILRDSDLAPQFLELELTESTIMADPARSLEVLTRLHALGVAISIDDFGTGYSSLAYLQKLPVDSLKIDRSFVSQMGNSSDARAIVSAIIVLAHTVGLKVTAEGIEDAAALASLTALGCDVAQGYYISRPLATEAATAWLLNAMKGDVGGGIDSDSNSDINQSRD